MHGDQGLTGAAVGAEGRPRVDVVLLNWNGWRDTVESLASVFRSEGARVRAVVCDNASTDGSPGAIRRWAGDRGLAFAAGDPSRPGEEVGGTGNGSGPGPPVVLIPTGGNLGFTGGCNVGIAHALARGADYVFLLNNDATVEPETVARLVGAAGRAGAAMAGARVLDGSGERVLFSGARWPGLLFGVGSASARDERGDVWDSDYASGCALLLRRDLLEERFRACGHYFDPAFFMYCEEVDLCLFGKSRGYRCVVARDAVIRHALAKSSGGLFNPRSYYYITRNRVRLANRWLGWGGKALFHAYYVPSRLAIQSLGRGRRRRDLIAVVARGVFDGYRGVTGKWKLHG